MRSREKTLQHAFAWPDSPSVVNVTVLHEDFESGVRSRAFVENLANQQPSPTPLKLDLWRFDVLRSPSPKITVANLSREAALVVLAARSAESLPAELAGWIGKWLQARQNGQPPCAFIIFLEDGRKRVPDRQPVLARLRQAAAERQLNMFWETWEATRALPMHGKAKDAAIQQAIRTDFLRNEERPRWGWGINE